MGVKYKYTEGTNLSRALHKAWDSLNNTGSEKMFLEFEEAFNIKLHYSDHQLEWLEFENEQEALWFILKWA